MSDISSLQLSGLQVLCDGVPTSAFYSKDVQLLSEQGIHTVQQLDDAFPDVLEVIARKTMSGFRERVNAALETEVESIAVLTDVSNGMFNGAIDTDVQGRPVVTMPYPEI